MKVKVKTVKQEVFDVELEAGMKVSDIKGAIETQVGDEKFRKDLLQIVFKGKRWTEDDATIEQMGVTEGCVIVVVVKQPAKPAAAPPVAQAAPPATTTPAAPSAAPASTETPAEGATGADAFATGSELQASIKAITEMGFEEAQVKRAMRAAFNNPDRAVEYLMTGIPDGLEAPAAQPGAVPTGQAPAATQPTAATPAPAAPPAQTPAPASGPNAAPLDMWGGGGGGAAAPTPAAPGGGMTDLLSQLRGSPNAAQRIQQMLQTDPNQLAALLQEIARSNPEVAQQLASNPGAFLEALSSLGGGGEGGAPPGTITVELTQDEHAAVGRLEALGFSRNACIQAYLACERSEEMAANFLLENATDEDMQ